jgi:hypothetical protein
MTLSIRGSDGGSDMSSPDGAPFRRLRENHTHLFSRLPPFSGVTVGGWSPRSRPMSCDVPTRTASPRPDYHDNSSRRAHHASAASIALSASGTLSIIQAVATQCRGIWVIIAGRNRRSSGVTGSGAELS